MNSLLAKYIIYLKHGRQLCASLEFSSAKLQSVYGICSQIKKAANEEKQKIKNPGNIVVGENDGIKDAFRRRDLNVDLKYIVNSRGNKIACYKCLPKYISNSKPKGIVFILHGYGEHFCYYDEITNIFKESGYVIYGQDLEGHGLSDGYRGVLAKVEHNTADIFQNIQEIRKEHPKQPLFAVGHSMGGGLILATTVMHSSAIDGAVVGSPFVMAHPRALKRKRSNVAVFLDHIYPNFVVTYRAFNVELWARDKEIQQKILRDPLVWKGGVKCGTVTNALRLSQFMERNMSKIVIPFLVLHGDADTLNLITGSEKLILQASSKDKELKIYENGIHPLFNEDWNIRKKVIQDTVSWIQNKTEEFQK